MVSWTTVNINDNQVERSTERAYLIKMPHNSDYDGFSFWYPIKLTHSGPHSASITLEIPDDFAFNLRRYSPRTRKLLDSVELDAYTLGKQLETVSQNITAPLDKSDEPVIEVKEPKYRKPEETEVPDCLKTNSRP